MSLSENDLSAFVEILRDIADDIESCGPEEWESIHDCINATKNNIEHDCNEEFGCTQNHTK